MELRPYQNEARDAVFREWSEGRKRTLLVQATGTGKTIVFSKIAETAVANGDRVLILAHRDELLQQARAKLSASCGLACSLEKADSHSVKEWERITVGSVQTMMREKRLKEFDHSHFDVIVIDEAHHALSKSYQNVLNWFPDSYVLGVTATPDRGDKKDLGQFFQSIAYEYPLAQAIKEGFLCRIHAQTIPIDIDLRGCSMSAGDYKASDVGNALDPYLEAIADEMVERCKDRKTVVFLPLIATSQKFCQMLNERGFRAAEVNGQSDDRKEILAAFDVGTYNVLCNSMLLTEGWDCPSVDCIVNLRPTKIRGLYCLDESTEVLTRDGWKTDVEVGEEVLAFDPETGETKFVPALAKVHRPLEPDEFFCSIRGQSTDIRVTNHHRMVYDNKRRNGWKVKEAQDISRMSDGAYIPVCGHGRFAGVPLTDAELTFLGWVMTDGSINPANNQITITQGEQQEAYCQEITRCIEECGFKYTRSTRRRSSTETHYNAHGDLVTWTVSRGKPRGRDKDKTGWARLEPWLSKDMSPELAEMTERQFSVMLEAIFHGDGNKSNTITYDIGKGNRTFIERLQAMAVQRGYRASVSIERANKVRKSDLYHVHIKRQDFVKVGATSGRHATWTMEPHSQEWCWCVQNELGTLVTRRNGKVAIVGNCQIVGRGTRLYPGKDHLLLLDFLWQTARHNLCRPASLLCKTEEVAEKMTEILEGGEEMDVEEAAEEAANDVVTEREEALAKQLEEMRKKKGRLIDPIQYGMSLSEEDLIDYEPTFEWEFLPPSEKQLSALGELDVDPERVPNAGYASVLLDRIKTRRENGMSSPKQIRLLERKGFRHVGDWTMSDASKLIGQIAANGWKTPKGIIPSQYKPVAAQPDPGWPDFMLPSQEETEQVGFKL